MSNSESDDDLEETPAFIRSSSPIKASFSNTSVFSLSSPRKNISEIFANSPLKSSKLDNLLSEQKKQDKEEEYIRQTKAELLKNIKDGSQDDNTQNSQYSETLAEEHACHIEQLELKESRLLPMHPGLSVFAESQYCQVFDKQISPDVVCFDPDTSIGAILASVHDSPARLKRLLQSKNLVMWVSQLPRPDLMLEWLLCLMSVCSIVSQYCFANFVQILQSKEVGIMSTKGKCLNIHFKNPALVLLRILVNLGASPEGLLGEQHSFSEAEIRKCMMPLVAHETEYKQEADRKPSLCKENLGWVLKAVTKYMQMSQQTQCLPKDALSDMVTMLAKTALETSLATYLQKDLKETVISVIENYSDSDWNEAIPDLCRKLSTVSPHHHDQAHLLTLFHSTTRGEQLQSRLAYLCLWGQLLGVQADLEDQQIMDFELQDLAWLGATPKADVTSTLTSGVLDLIDQDKLYKVASILRMLDFAVGGDKSRAARPKDQLEFLFHEIKHAIKGIKDGIFQQDHSKIKDVLSRLKVKWSLTLDRKKTTDKNQQRSIFAFATSTSHQVVSQEHLKTLNSSQTDIDEEEI